ncbi:MAG: hypothetical protein JJE04_04185 [Acidobacteriia bacterium]|nr:hypothetical protein [Terriglobia bacterium]
MAADFRMARSLTLLALTLLPNLTADYRPPADDKPAQRRPGAASILPGGRQITPLGRQYGTGPGPFGLAVSPGGKTVVSADGGPGRYAVTTLQRNKRTGWTSEHFVARRKGEPGDDDADNWRSVFMGLAFTSDHHVLVSEGNSGRVRWIDARTGKPRHIFHLNTDGYKDSYSGDLAYDASRQRLYVLDQANFRLAAFDTIKRRALFSIRTGRLPFAMALSPDGKRAYVAGIGMFEYKPIPGARREQARDTGLPFPAFGFPSPEALAGAQRDTALGPVQVPGLGDPNVVESNSIAVINLENQNEPKLERFIRTGLPFGPSSKGGSSPSGVTATADRIFVSNGHNDSISVISAATLELEKEIPLRIPGLEHLRGILPIGSLYHPETGWLLVAEAGINAIGVIDTRTLEVIGHLPTAWFPTRIAVDDATGTLFVSCAKGNGTGPNASRRGPEPGSFQGERRRGAINIFPLPDPSEIAEQTKRVFANNGFFQRPQLPAPVPSAIEYVVIIVKENRTFDEVFGDITSASNGAVAGLPVLARYGRHGIVRPPREDLTKRLSLRDINVTPNHHEMARRWAFSDNFYADAEVSVDGHHWLVGSYPNAWTESTLMASYGGQKDFRFPTTAPGRLLFAQSNSSVHPEEQLEAGALWHHLERHGITFRNFGEGFELAGADEGQGLKPTGARYLTNVPMPDPLYRNTSRNYPNYNMNIPDQFRATQFINEIDELYVKPGKPLPRLLYIHLPGDHIAKPRPDDGYPFAASFVSDNDYALGRIVEYLSHTKWWPRMAIFVTEDDAQGGVDHIDSHRTIFMVASPYARKNHVSHVNTSFPSLLKTVFRLLRLPPLNLYDATAADLADCFTTSPDLTPYKVLPTDKEIFDPALAREPLDPQPSPRMDDPRVLSEQHRRQR